MTDLLIDSLIRAVDTAPDDVRLRTHLAELLMDAGRSAEAVTHCAIALQHAPTDEAARALMSRALSPQAAQAPAERTAGTAPEPAAEAPVPAEASHPSPPPPALWNSRIPL